MTQAKTKEEYMLERLGKWRPASYRRAEHEWEVLQNTPPTDNKIDWEKPLRCINTAVTKIEYIQRINLDPEGISYVCRFTYKGNYTYYVMFDEYGHTRGQNASTANVKNEVTSWGKSAWMVLNRMGQVLHTRFDNKVEAVNWAIKHYPSHEREGFQYIRYDYTESR